jgi:hypothetical protein
MSEKFTGGDSLTEKDGLKYYIHKTMMVNELAGGAGAYQISNAQNAASGPSFGPIQYDLGSNQDGRNLFESIARSATDAKGNRIISDADLQKIQDNLYKPFNKMTDAEKAVYAQLKPKMDQALGSAEGKSQINADYLKVLDTKVAHVNEVVAGVTNPTNKAYLEGDLKSQVMIADIANQYGPKVNAKLAEFLSQASTDAGVKLPGDGKLVKVDGAFDSSDIHSFRMATEYGVNHPKDANRRDNNIDTIVGNNKLTVSNANPSTDAPQGTTVKVGSEEFTIRGNPASIFKTPDAQAPIATLTKPDVNLEGIKFLLGTAFKGQGTPTSPDTPTPEGPARNRDIQQPTVTPRM